MRKRLVFLILVAMCCSAFFGCNSRGKQTAYWEETQNLLTTIRTLQTTVFIEKANLDAGIEYPESIKEQEELFSSLMQSLKKKDELWESFQLVADDVCGLLYIDSFFGKEYHDFLVEKLSLYVYEEGLLSIYKKQPYPVDLGNEFLTWFIGSALRCCAMLSTKRFTAVLNLPACFISPSFAYRKASYSQINAPCASLWRN